MYSTIFLLDYQSGDNEFYDSCSKKIKSAFIDNKTFNSIESLLEDKEIYESKYCNDKIVIKVLPSKNLPKAKDILIYSCLKEIEKIDIKLIQDNLIENIISITQKGNILELFLTKIEEYKDDEYVILMLGN